ncbi:MAG: hypothetical protein ACT4OM_04415 [Actinomycetota bacterium]
MSSNTGGPIDLFAAFNTPKEGEEPEPPRRKSLGAVAKENAVVRRKAAGVAEDGLLGAAREDVEKEGFRPGTYYRPFF